MKQEWNGGAGGGGVEEVGGGGGRGGGIGGVILPNLRKSRLQIPPPEYSGT